MRGGGDTQTLPAVIKIVLRGTGDAKTLLLHSLMPFAPACAHSHPNSHLVNVSQSNIFK